MFLTYRRFYEQETIREFVEILKDNEIEFEISEESENLDSAIIGDNQFRKCFSVRLRKEDFTKVDLILATESQDGLESVSQEHYLYEFSDDELFDILAKPDEWSEFDYQLSKKILLKRGKEINENTIELLKKRRIRELAKPEEGQKTWIYAGYFFALSGGVLGIFIGWHLITSRKVLPNGERVMAYSTKDRKHGKYILIIGVVMAIAVTAFKIAISDH